MANNRWKMVACVCAMTWLAADTATRAQTTWPEASGGNGHTYEVIDEDAVGGLTGVEAAALPQATAEGCSLATITSAAENAFVQGLIDNPAWIGGRQPDGEALPGDNWGWDTGEPFAYQNWNPDLPLPQPDDGSGAEDNDENCLEFSTDGTWYDSACTSNLTGAVVECEAAASVVPVPAISPAGGSLLAAALMLAAVYVLRGMRRRNG